MGTGGKRSSVFHSFHVGHFSDPPWVSVPVFALPALPYAQEAG